MVGPRRSSENPSKLGPPPLGHHPQAVNHVGVVSSGMNLARLTRGQR